MILAPDRSKLSKRHGATSVSDYRKQGFLAEALLNYLVLLGWSSPLGQELMPRDEIITQFGLDRISKSGAIFDLVKLKWMNGQYIRKLEAPALFEAVTPFLEPTLLSAFSPDLQQKIVFSVRDNLDVLGDINTFVSVYALTQDQYIEKIAQITWSDTDKIVITAWKDWLAAHPTPTPEDIQAGLDHIVTTTQLGKGKVFKPIRVACSGIGNGPHLPDLLSILPTATLIERCTYVLDRA